MWRILKLLLWLKEFWRIEMFNRVPIPGLNNYSARQWENCILPCIPTGLFWGQNVLAMKVLNINYNDTQVCIIIIINYTTIL